MEKRLLISTKNAVYKICNVTLNIARTVILDIPDRKIMVIWKVFEFKGARLPP